MESPENAQSHTHMLWRLSSAVRAKSSVTSYTCAVLSEEVVANRLESGLKQHLRAYPVVCAFSFRRALKSSPDRSQM